MKELVVISGKGGTGKTSILASFAVLAGDAVIADCDVDAADLHLLLAPEVKEKHDFISGHEAVIRHDVCTACGACLNLCRFGAIKETRDSSGNSTFAVDPLSCEGCGVCVRFCPKNAVDFPDRNCGVWMASETRCGPMVHARLAAAAENSGRLVATVRQEARRIAEQRQRGLILVDGPPGIGCPVIASITGASSVLVVAEPTLSSAHDLKRVLSLAKYFSIPAAVCVNKWDINPGMTARIERQAEAAGALNAGRIRYDESVTKAQMQTLSVVETGAPSAADIRSVWNAISQQGKGENA